MGRKMRIAFADLSFSWPPQGGAQVNVYNTALGLQEAGHEVHLFAPAYDDFWWHESFDPAALAFPATPMPATWARLTGTKLADLFVRYIRPWRPDLVYFGLGHYFKPYVIEALAEYPIVSRYYMYENLCLRGFTLFKEDQTCPNDFPRTPNVCRRCALMGWRDKIPTGEPDPFGYELLRSRALAPAYHGLFLRALAQCRAVVVNNALAKERLEGYCQETHVIPGGVSVEQFEHEPLRDREERERAAIFMPGRASDPLKGLDILARTAEALAEWRSDFEVWVTETEDRLEQPWYKPLGWRDRRGVRDLYRQADIVVVPSVWDEPYGLVGVEAMAAGRPLVASRVGGLQAIVREGETGYLFHRESSASLAFYLNHLLDRPELRARMGARGREIAEQEHTWRRIIERDYLPLLERIAA